jgi:hypothetical protein
MSATATIRRTVNPADAARRRRHQFWIQAGAAAALLVTIVLIVYGLPYYVLSPARRLLSPHHIALKPSGTVGKALGIAGTALLVLIYLYPLRKKWKWLARKGKTKNWLDYHILMGLAAPVLITFHAAFKLRGGVAGMAYWSMIAVVMSGIVGRYLYSRIPRKLGAVEMSIDEMEKLRADLAAQIEAQNLLGREELDRILVLPSTDEVKRQPLLKALWKVGSLDLQRWIAIWRLRRRASARVHNHEDLRAILEVVRKQASLSKDVLFLSKIRQLFHLWHIVHRPFSWALAILAVLHVVVVTFLGF